MAFDTETVVCSVDEACVCETDVWAWLTSVVDIAWSVVDVDTAPLASVALVSEREAEEA